MNVLLASLLLAVPQETPEQAFRKIEARIEAAKSWRVTFKIDSLDKKDIPGFGSFFLEESGRMRLKVAGNDSKGKEYSILVESDGTTIKSSFKGRAFTGVGDSFESRIEPRLQRTNFNMYLSRLGCFMGGALDAGVRAGAKKRKVDGAVDLKSLIEVRDVKDLGSGRNDTRILKYSFKSEFQPLPMQEARIWYDPKTYRMTRREMDIKLADGDETIIEIYDEFEFDRGDAPPKPAAEPAMPDAELAALFWQAKFQVAEAHLKAGRKDKAAEIFEELIKTYPKHPNIPDARRLLEEAKKK